MQTISKSSVRPVGGTPAKHSVFRMNRGAAGGSGITQFGRALGELNIEILCANSSQAKGRVERANRALQDRLVKELRLSQISTVEAGNDFLPGFIERFNERFAVVPAKPEDMHHKVHLPTSRLTDILCHREQRYLSAQLTFHYDRRQIILECNKTSEELAGKYVDLYDYTDGRLEVRWKGISLPYRVFSKDQRITQTAIVENKRLSHALSLVKAQQDLKRETKVLTNSEKTGYKRRSRSVYGPDFTETPEPKAVMRYKRQIRFAHPATFQLCTNRTKEGEPHGSLLSRCPDHLPCGRDASAAFSLRLLVAEGHVNIATFLTVSSSWPTLIELSRGVDSLVI